MSKWLPALIIALMVPVSPALAGGESVMPDSGPDSSEFGDLGPAALLFPKTRARATAPTAEITAALVREVERGARYCALLPRIEYSLDCLSDRMAFTVKLIPRIRQYAELRTALSVASRETRQLVRQNRSRDLPTGSVALGQGGTRTRALVPFDPAKRDLVLARTEEIVQTARSRMWRVAAQSAEVRVHYEAFATAIGTYYIFKAGAFAERG